MTDALKALLEQIGKGQYADLTVEQLSEAQSEITAALAAWKADKSIYTADEVKSLLDSVKAVKTEVETRTAATSDLEAQVEALVPEPAQPEPETPKPSLASVLAKRPAQAVPAAEPTPPADEPESPAVEIIAASGGPQSPVAEDGQRLTSLTEIGQAMDAAWRGTRPPANGAVYNRAVQKRWNAALRVDEAGKAQDNFAALQAAIHIGQERAKASLYGGDGDVLQAATGICGPLEPKFSFLNLIGQDGLIDLTDVGVARGGLRIPQAVTYDDIDGQAAIAYPYTSQMGADSGTKPCFTVTCPGISDFLVIAYQTCLRFGNFSGQFFPEYVEHVSDVAMATHAHKVNLALILAITTNADTVTYDSNGATKLGGAWTQFVRQTTFHSWLYRSKYRTSQDLVLEHVYPYRALGALIADTAARQSSTPTETAGTVTAAVAAHGREIGTRFQFVHDWQEMTQAPGDFGSEAYSSLLFPAGNLIHMTGETLDLGVVRDSTRNAANEFDNWVETFDGIASAGYENMLITDQRFCPDGTTGGTVTISCTTAS